MDVLRPCAVQEFLAQAEAYPHGTRSVEVVETHMSWVFLTDRFAWKLKKPLRYEYLDFSTLEARQRNCLAEVRLNRRLANGVYLGVVPVTREPETGLRLCGSGEPVDWLVWMQRLPREAFLDRLVRQGRVPAEALRRAARKLGAFYRRLPAEKATPEEYVERLRRETLADLEELDRLAGWLPMPRPGTLRQVFDRAWDGAGDELRERSGQVREVHGDLRPQHLCLAAEPVFIDSLEFNREFRLMDPAEELSLLALECDLLGAPEVGGIFLEAYHAETGDEPSHSLLALYRARRAVLRAKLSLWHGRHAGGPPPPPWPARAGGYLEEATRALSRFLPSASRKSRARTRLRARPA